MSFPVTDPGVLPQPLGNPDEKNEIGQHSDPGHAKKEKVDLIILPATGKDVSKVFLGSSSTHVVERSPCSVLVVRP